jgi:hypothetical protein
VQLAVALAIVVTICFTAGVVVANPLGARLTERVEQLALQDVPGYAMLKGLMQRFAGSAEGTELPRRSRGSTVQTHGRPVS